MNTVYIFTEIVHCGKIGKIAIASFHKHHNHKIHIWGTKDDFELLEPHENSVYIEVDQSIIDGYKKGHLGTALLWEYVIKKSDSEYIIHFDSDTIFRQNIIDEMISLTPRYDLIGPIRNYHHNPQNINQIRHLTDICQTNCILFKKSNISPKYLKNKKNLPSLRDSITLPPIQILRNIKWYIVSIFKNTHISQFAKMIHGTYNPFSFPTIDFFDPIMFDMVKNGARIYHLDFNAVGGCNYYGERNNTHKELNNFPTPYKIDFGSKLVHFSCVGSGMNFYNNKEKIRGVGKEYVTCALDRYALFCKIFYNENIPDNNLEKYKDILMIKEWY